MNKRRGLFILGFCLAGLLMATSLSLLPTSAFAEGGSGAYVPGTSGITLPSLSLSFVNSQKPQDMVSGAQNHR